MVSLGQAVMGKAEICTGDCNISKDQGLIAMGLLPSEQGVALQGTGGGYPKQPAYSMTHLNRVFPMFMNARLAVRMG